ncbi:hypothetical protein SL003B_0399 [Polymorphum gilvum SL003B-26A1]|uniref:Uncharacterized protein n=1 Tax=Polymorphum gilvum (strain LMG 25793 / CGMCC 1.9160 / SL003B-26A1) TaxID=991905 RepID=F2J276_POLGS|nr:hypothetical protein SL003B_0399 [Polymorphum gilvum SL003B-26A1]
MGLAGVGRAQNRGHGLRPCRRRERHVLSWRHRGGKLRCSLAGERARVLSAGCLAQAAPLCPASFSRRKRGRARPARRKKESRSGVMPCGLVLRFEA